MEVHAHTHTPRKKWTHYFWEFLMLFLAVFCGFLAEYQLEHKIERNREKQYIESFIADLKADTSILDDAINLRLRRARRCDSLIMLLKSSDKEINTGKIYQLALQLSSSNRITYNDRTIQQLRNAGGLRLIRSKGASDTITYYDINFRRMQLSEDQSLEVLREYRAVAEKLFDASVFLTMVDSIDNSIIKTPPGNPKLLSRDTQIINDVCVQLLFYRQENLAIAKFHKMRLLPKAVSAIEFLKKEYRLE